jgi:hypothetical protein
MLAVLVTAFYELWSRNATAQTALRGAIVPAVAVVIMTGVTILRPHWRYVSWLKLLSFVGGSMAASLLLSVSPIRILLIAALLGYFWPVAEPHK